MSNSNRYTALSDVYGDAEVEGWEDDVDIGEADSDSSSSAEDAQEDDRRRKISQGVRDPPQRNLTFSPEKQIVVQTKSMGRGGGISPSDNDRLGILPTIAEGFEVETEVEQDLDTTLQCSIPPNKTPEEQKRFFTFRAQLTYGLNRGTKVHLPDLFRKWVAISSHQIPDFALLPFEDEKGLTVNVPDQVPEENPTFFKEYYFNHHVLHHGNLTGMVHFRCSVSWNKIKRVQDEYFQWLHNNKVYLNLTKFKTDTLVICGFFVGAHPGHLRREDAESEIRTRLNLPPEFQFQLSSRTISVPISTSKTERYSFPAVAIESSARLAKRLRESMFSLPKPSEATNNYPYTGI
jgi:hypothetical protein